MLKSALDPGSYKWISVPVAGKAFTASGTADCHWANLEPSGRTGDG